MRIGAHSQRVPVEHGHAHSRIFLCDRAQADNRDRIKPGDLILFLSKGRGERAQGAASKKSG
jgi:hypothetical protein